ncbi:MAG: cobalamin biosynthesis protein [Deltaproteobacteria bacterium]|nr:MAG: cobalamin biosynthesis protein [Deltaproteobacteria bacterium]
MDSQVFSDSSAALLISAFLLDLAVGDPHWLPHPVVFMGKFIYYGESWLRSGRARCAFLAGMALSLSLIALSAAAAWALIALIILLPRWLSFIAKTDRGPAARRRSQCCPRKTLAHRWA